MDRRDFTKRLSMWLPTILFSSSIAKTKKIDFERINGNKARNVILILSDDHRYDFMGFTGKVPWLKTPNMDRLANHGIHCENAFVTTSLCSPSRASILTGLYAHSHRVVDNSAPAPENLIFFPQYLQSAGYETAFIGKWHMGDYNDEPRPGFDHWVSFLGQGNYYKPTLNINGSRVSYDESTYITDLLTEHAVSWMKKRKGEKPFFLYLSHKAVHANFRPAKRHQGLYKDMEIFYPPSYDTTKPENLRIDGKHYKISNENNPHYNYGKGRIPDWVKNQRYSWHGVDYLYNGLMDFPTFYRNYCETVLGIDDSIGTLLSYLEETGELDSTMIIYMGDNGFSFGEHGLIDKRHFYEESARIPLLIHCPELFKGGQILKQMVQNIDIAPTILDCFGLKKPDYMQGESILPLLQKKNVKWRDRIFYEYYWEEQFPQTPTTFGIRTDRYKYIRYHGIWDTNEFYDLEKDPYEMNNLIRNPIYQELIETLVNELYDWLENTSGLNIPLKRPLTPRFEGDYRNTHLY